MSSFISAAPVASGQVQSLDSLRGHSLPTDAMILASATQVNPTNQNTGSYAIVESGVNSLGVTATGSVPATTLSPFADVYKEGSVYFSGATGNYLQNTATYSNSTIQWNTTGMTIEAWVNYQSFTGASSTVASSPTPQQAPTLFGTMAPATSTNYWGFGANTTGYVTFYYYSSVGGESVMAQTPLSANTWNHIAATSSTSGQIFVFINGVQSQVVANRNGNLQAAAYYETVQGTPVVSATPLAIGQYNSTAVNAYVADLRLTTGTPLYTGSTSSYATFTVPSAPLSSTTSPGVTQFLLRAGQNSPTVQNGALTFDRGLKQYMNFGPQTFNIVTQGFTAIWRGQFTGTAGNYETIFEGGLYGTNNGGIFIGRAGTSTGLYFQASASTGTSAVFTVGAPSVITQGTQTVIAARYNPVTSLADIWINGVFQASATCSPATLVGDRIVSGSYIGYPYATNSFTSMTSNTLAVYNRALSNVEILNSYLALNTVPATPQQKTLEIGDINGTPALSVAGNGQVSVQSIGLSSNVVPWPPAAMTGYDTVINGGVYKARASTENSGAYAWYAFDKNTTNYWNWNFSILGNLYPGGAGITYGNYTGPVTTTDAQGTVYKGEWIQLQLPTRISLSSYTVYGQSPTYDPGTFFVLGSNDGVNWTLVSSQVFVPWTTTPQTLTFQAQSSQTFSYFRMVIGAIMSSGTGNYSIPFSEWTLYGTADTSPALTIAPATTFNTSVATPSLTGVAGSGFVPQDFSSSGLNIPAYVVSNTATVANTVQYSSMGPFAGEGSLYFPGGTGAYVNFGTAVNGLWPGGGSLTDGTIEMWVYQTQRASSGDTLISRQSGLGTSGTWSIAQDSNGTIYFSGYNGTTTFTTQVSAGPLNTWFHIAASVKSGSMTVFMNGVPGGSPASFTGTLAGSSSYILSIVNTSSATSFNGYISGVRLTTGQALYTTTFTPPTGPLPPIQGTTQAGLPYGTVLLLRNAPAPGRIQTTKFSGANSGSVLAFPPAAMTGYSTSLNAGYGQGTYVASASSEYDSSVQAWKAFDKSSTTWQTTTAVYNSTTPYGPAAGSPVTVDIAGNSYTGQWLQIINPSSIVLSSYSLVQYPSDATKGFASWYILGSRDGTNWYLVDQRSSIAYVSGPAVTTYTVSSSQSFTYFRFVGANVTGNSGLGLGGLSEWTLNGTIESVNVTADGRVGLGVVAPVQALEVAGSAVVAGTLSAGNPLMFRNRIINGDFRIDQRGSASTPATTGYGPDRWLISSAATAASIQRYTLTTSSDDVVLKQGYKFGVQVNRGSSGNMDLQQTIELGNCVDLYNQPVTLSFWARSTSAAGVLIYVQFSTDGTSSFTNGGGVGAALTTSWTYFTIPIPVPSIYTTSTDLTKIGTQLIIRAQNGVMPNGSTQYYTGVQLEKGTVATPFEVRPVGIELSLCQRYFHRTCNVATQNGGTMLIPMVIIDSTRAQGIYKLPVSMRSNAITLNSTGTFTLDWWQVNNNGVTAVTAANAVMTSSDNASVIATGVTNGTVGSVTIGQVRFLTTSTGYIDFSAEL